MKIKGLLILAMTSTICLLQAISCFAQDKFKILSIYPEKSTIAVKNRTLRVGDVFAAPDDIVWKKDQEMWAVSTKDNTPYFFSEAAFKQAESRTAAEYIAYLSASSKSAPKIWPTLNKHTDSQDFPDKRIALVIGNSNYVSPVVPSLKTPCADASAVADKLRSLGFDVIIGYDGVFKDLKSNIINFYNISKDYDVSLLYYAGHGARYEDKDYILPSDFTPDSSYDLDRAIPVKEITSMAYDSYIETKLIVLDACRDKISFSNARSLSDDDFNIQVPKGQCVIYSTGSNKTAQDIISSKDNNSPFAKVFLDEIGKKGQTLSTTLTNIKTRVYNDTGTAQLPVAVDQLTHSDFCFNPLPVYGKLSIVSNPSDATIILDGVRQSQTTNVTYTGLKPGKHTVTLELNGYKKYNEDIYVVAGQTLSINCSLERLPVPESPTTGDIEIITIPEGATLMVDGTELKNKSNVTYRELSPGAHKLKCTLKGFEDYITTFNIEPGKTKTITITLQKQVVSTGFLNLRVYPSSSIVLVDDSHEPKDKIALKPGLHHIQAYKEGFVTYETYIAVAEGEDKQLRIELKEKFSHRITSYVNNSWDNWQLSGGYTYTPGFPLGFSISGGWGIYDLSATFGFPRPQFEGSSSKGYFMMDNEGLWYPSFSWSVTPSIKLKYFGIGVGLGQICPSSNPYLGYDFPFKDDVSGKRFDIDNQANLIYCGEVKTDSFFTITPTAYGYIPLGDYASELYFGVGYMICPLWKQRNGITFTIGCRFNSGNY